MSNSKERNEKHKGYEGQAGHARGEYGNRCLQKFLRFHLTNIDLSEPTLDLQSEVLWGYQALVFDRSF